MNQDAPVTVLKGIGEKTAEHFAKAGIETIRDLISYYPRDYETFEEPGTVENAADGQIKAVCGFMQKSPAVRYYGGKKIITGQIITPDGKTGVTWFNMPYLRSQIKPGVRYVFRGHVRVKGNVRSLLQPAMYSPEEYGELMARLQPVYPLVSGLTEHMLTKAMTQAMEDVQTLPDCLPEDLRRQYQLAEQGFALQQIHFPENKEKLLTARRRLVFEEFLLFILALRTLKETRKVSVRSDCLKKVPQTRQILDNLPYELTGAQKKVWDQVETDMTRPEVMARLIQGDVGSGKTIIAFLGLVTAAENGAQGALMVPTEVLARQHYDAFLKLTEQAGLEEHPVLLVGSMTAKQKREAYARIESGEAKVIIGTHALIQEKVNYQRLALVITDEQHRFGVKQREALSVKGEMPHTIVMSATPIPRTLAVILYGDLDVSVIDEMPASRLPIKNCVVNTAWRPKAYTFIEREVKAGHQAYVICPMVEESENMEGENVIDYTEMLRAALPPEITVEYLHGRMDASEKNEVMERFVSGQTQVLVSTTVIEVGVNVPNATVMLIENAERFGLAQLHQLRGRVGRGSDQSYCIMIHSGQNEEKCKRLEILNKSNDGFEIAAEDLKLRGPGDLFGVRQSGILAFRIADVFNDAPVMEQAAEAAGILMETDPGLELEENRRLSQRLTAYLGNGLGELNL